MSVVMEAVSVVIPRAVLDQKYPGGTNGYLVAAGAPDSTARHACADDHLTSVSFLNPDLAEAWGQTLAAHGIVDVGDGGTHEIVYVDQQSGPTTPCSWLAWCQSKEGYTFGWSAGTAPGKLVTPAHWAPEESRRLRRTDAPGDLGRLLRLSEENGLETWLDFETGQQRITLADRGPDLTAELGVRDPGTGADATSGDPSLPHPAGSPPAAQPRLSDRIRRLHDVGMRPREDSPNQESQRAAQSARLGPIATVVCGALKEIDFTYETPSPEFIRFPITSDLGTSFPVLVWIDERTQTVTYHGVLPMTMPESQRTEIGELLTRINFSIRLGNFEMNWTDGTIRYRYAIDMEFGVLTPGMARLAIARISPFCDWCLDAVLRVMYANTSAEDAHHEFEEKMRRGSGGAPAS